MNTRNKATATDGMGELVVCRQPGVVSVHRNGFTGGGLYVQDYRLSRDYFFGELTEGEVIEWRESVVDLPPGRDSDLPKPTKSTLYRTP